MTKMAFKKTPNALYIRLIAQLYHSVQFQADHLADRLVEILPL